MNSAIKSTRTSHESLFRTIFLIAGLGTLSIATNFLDPINLPKLVAVLVPVPWLVLHLSRTIGRVSNFRELILDRTRIIFLIAILSILSLTLISPAPLERRLLGTWGRNNGLLILLVSVLLAWGAYEIAKQNFDIVRFFKATLYILIPTGIYGLVQVIGKDPIAWSSGSMKIFATFGNTNFAAAAWALGALVSASLILFDSTSSKINHTKFKKFFYTSNFIIFTYLSFMTKSIQGLFAIASFLSLISLFKLLSFRTLLPRVIAGVIFLTGTVIAFSIFFTGPLTSLISTAGSLGFRKIYWNIGLGMFLREPFTGVGVDSFGDFYRNVRDSNMATTTSIDLVVNNAHNTFIQALATLGVFGLLIVLLPVFMTLSFGLVQIIRNSKFDVNTTIFSIFVGLWLMAAFSIDNISITLWNWIYLGAALGVLSKSNSKESEDTPIRKPKNRRQTSIQMYDFGKVLSSILSITTFFFAWTSANADRKIVTVLRTPASFSQPETINERLLALGEVSRLRILDPQHYLTIARALVELQQVPQSIEVLAKGVAEYPRDFALWDSLAYSLEQQGRIQEAVIAREKQVELDPRHARIWSYLAQDYLKNNEQNKAKMAANESLKNLSIFAAGDQEIIRNFLKQLNLA
jgi:O-antigen ligase